MPIKAPDQLYLEQAERLTEDETERLLSRMGKKLRRRHDKDKVSIVEALAIQLEMEDEQLREWRERMDALKMAEKKS